MGLWPESEGRGTNTFQLLTTLKVTVSIISPTAVIGVIKGNNESTLAGAHLLNNYERQRQNR